MEDQLPAQTHCRYPCRETGECLAWLGREWRISRLLSLKDTTLTGESSLCCLLPPGGGRKISSLFGLAHTSQVGNFGVGYLPRVGIEVEDLLPDWLC